MEALTEYAYRARLRDITDMSVLVEASASKMGKTMRISSNSLANVHRMNASFNRFYNYICLTDEPIIDWFFISFRFQMSGDTSTPSVRERDKPFFNSKFSTESTGRSWTTFPKGATLIYPLTRITVISVTNLTSPLKLASGMESDLT